MIPDRLKREEFRFIKIRRGDKRPIETGWQSTKNYSHDDATINAWTKADNNYGVVGGHGRLLIIDFDCQKFQDEMLGRLPKTFSVKTGGSGLLHLYYISDDPASFKILDKDKKTLADIQGRGKQVIGAGSLHPKGGRYVVEQDVDIAKITLAGLKRVFNDYLPKEHQAPNRDSFDNGRIVEEIKNKVRITDYDHGMKMGLQCCPFHSDKSPSFSVWADGKAFNCFSSCGGGDIFSYVMLKENCDFKQAKMILMKEAGIEIQNDNYKQIVPKNDAGFDEFRVRVLELLANNKSIDATELIAQYLLQKECIRTTRDDERSEMWIYKEGIYVPQAKTFIKEFARKTLGKAYKKHLVSQIIEKIEVDTYVEQAKFFINEDVNLIAVQNGILNLKTKRIQSFDSKFNFFNKLPIEYEENVGCPAIRHFLSEVLANKEDVEVIQELFGYLLYREYSIEKAVMFHGSGRNGKGKTIDLMKRFIGAENCANITLQSLDKDQFAMGELFNKMANLAADLPAGMLQDTGNFKSLTGRDLISAPRKFLTRVHFVNYAKMIFSANDLPQTNDITPAFFLRWLILDFPYTFLSQKEYDFRENKEGIKLADQNIIDKISTPQEMKGLLNWALDGLERIRAKGDFSYSKSTKDVKGQWLRKSSSLNAFIEDCIEVNYGRQTIKKDFKTAYWMYCEEQTLKPLKDKEIREVLTTNFPVTEGRINTSEDRERIWENIQFKPSSGINKKLDMLSFIKE
jgi:P4 family phage/plasmid primase-like protien